MRLLAVVAALLALTVVPFHGEIHVVVVGLILMLTATVHRARLVRA